MINPKFFSSLTFICPCNREELKKNPESTFFLLSFKLRNLVDVTGIFIKKEENEAFISNTDFH